VVDIGAGTAYFETRMKEPTAKLIAADADERFVKYIDQRINAEKLSNVQSRLASYQSPPLQKSEADIVFMVNVYHHIENRIDYFKQLKSGLKQNGHLVIVDFKKGNFEVGPPDEMKLNAAEVITEMKNAGFILIKSDSTTLIYQYMLKFK
jgi:SAM-dependent methyltransferase